MDGHMPWRRLAARALQVFIGAGCIVLAIEAAAWAYPPVLPWALAAMGRSPYCSAAQAFKGTAARLDEARLTEALTASAAKTASVNGLNQWQFGPTEQWWAPAGADGSLPLLLAQQRSGIYRGKDFSGKVVLDCGAHVGLYTRTVLDAGAERVVAIEPAPANINCIRRNLSADIEAGRVIVYPKGVWNREMLLTLYESPENSAGDSFVIRAASDVATHNIPVTTIDKLVAELNLPRVDLVKMDIKGATLQAIEGMTRTLAKDHPRIVISTEEEEDPPKPIIDALAKHGYRAECGFCAVDEAYSVTPTVLFFTPSR
jgi:FkbM family methyltransferase